MELKCKCGASVDIDENLTDNMQCPYCSETITFKENAPEKYKQFEDERIGLEKDLKALIDDYAETEKFERIKTTITCWYNKSYRRFNLHDVWRTFISAAAGVAATKKHKELQVFLKKHARDFDTVNKQAFDNSLYVSLMKSYPNIGDNNDWDELIRQTDGDIDKFIGLNESIIKYIVKYQDKAFAMDIFNLIANNGKEWTYVGRVYLRALLSNKEVVSNVFPVSAFNGRTKKFARNLQTYCQNYLDNEITFEETEFGKTYIEACKRQKRRNIIIISSIMAVILITSIAIVLYLNAVNTDSVEFDIDKVIEVTYGETLDLSKYKVTYKKNSGASVSEPITTKMLIDYDPEKIGTQTVYVEYDGVKIGITIRVNPATLKTPVLEQSGNYITWDFVANAQDYSVYVNSTSSPVATTSELSYDLSSISYFGEITISVRANAASEKYRDSATLQEMTVTKLQSPTNIRYEKGELGWDSVDGASVYELTVNGIPYTTSVNSYAINLGQGNNELLIIAKSSLSSVVDGVTNQTLFYRKIAPITSLSYASGLISWDAESSATVFSVYVDGAYWKDFYRNYFSIEDDGFLSEFEESEHTIGIVCKSFVAGYESSESASYGVCIGNYAVKDGNVLRWNAIGTGATYKVSVNGEAEYQLSSPVISLADMPYKEGQNVISVTAILDNKTVIFESVVIMKLSSPAVSVVGGNWQTDGNKNNRYSINGGEWSAELPDTSELLPGDYTVVAKRIISSESAFEVESDPLEIKIRKLGAPTIDVSSDEIISSFDQSKYGLNLYYSEDADGVYDEIADLSQIRTAGEYFIKAKLYALGGTESGFDYVLDSEYSSSVNVVKLDAPSVFYNDGNDRVTSDAINVKFYYIHNGEECELKDGLISNLPQGIFDIYGRRIAQTNNELTSENTPVDKRAKVFNMDITLSINPYAGSQSQFYAVFGGCDEIDEITFSYELRYYDRNGTYLGNRIQSVFTLQKNPNVSTSNIMTLINYRLNISFEPGYTQTDIYEVELIVTLSSGENAQQLTARMTVN